MATVIGSHETIIIRVGQVKQVAEYYCFSRGKVQAPPLYHKLVMEQHVVFDLLRVGLVHILCVFKGLQT